MNSNSSSTSSSPLLSYTKNRVVGDFIYIMKTTFDFNLDLYQAFKQHEYTKTWKQREAVN